MKKKPHRIEETLFGGSRGAHRLVHNVPIVKSFDDLQAAPIGELRLLNSVSMEIAEQAIAGHRIIFQTMIHKGLGSHLAAVALRYEATPETKPSGAITALTTIHDAYFPDGPRSS